MEEINSSISFDKRLFHEDIIASIAHAQMLAKQNIISKGEGLKIINGLKRIYKEIEKGNFREDLYYRLNVFPLATKDLYTRKDDIIPITTALLIKHATDVTKIPYLSTKAIAKLLNHSWPGNVRELENVVQRALVLQSGNTINDEDIIVDVDPENIRLNENIFKNKHELRLAAE